MDVTIDIETYYDSEYSLKKMTMTEYIRHPKFKLQSLAIKVEDQETQYYDTENIPQAIDFISNLPRPWIFVGQNTAFDAAALNWHYGVRPDMYADTMSMSRAYWPGESASLDALGKRLFPNDPSLHKIHGTLESFLGVETLTPEQHERMAIYNKRDVDLTYRVYKTLLSFGFPEEELYQVHMIIRMYAEPMFVTDAPLLREAIHDDVTETENAIERALEAIRLHGIPDTFDLPLDVKLFSSNPRYARLLSEVFGLKPPMKTNTKGAATYAFGKKDVPYIRFKDDNPELEPIFIARELAKSTISATRAQTLLNCSGDGVLPLPVPLKYYGAATGRYSGCLTSDTKIIVKRGNSHEYIELGALQDDDLVWDGEDFVHHEGLQFMGYQEVIKHDGITATKQHPCFVSEDETRTLAELKNSGTPIMDSPLPRAMARDYTIKLMYGQVPITQKRTEK